MALIIPRAFFSYRAQPGLFFPSLHLNCESSTIVNKSWWWAGQRHRWGDSLNNVSLRVKKELVFARRRTSRKVDRWIILLNVSM